MHLPWRLEAHGALRRGLHRTAPSVPFGAAPALRSSSTARYSSTGSFFSFHSRQPPAIEVTFL